MNKDEELNPIEQFGRSLIPTRYRPGLRKYLYSAGVYKKPYTFFSGLFVVALIITGYTYFAFGIFGLLSEMNPVLVGISTFLYWIIMGAIVVAVMMGGVYFYLNMKVYNRIKQIEDHLIDYLVVVSTNLKGGLSFEKSLWASIKPDFGILSEEMSNVSKRVMTGSDLTEALQEFSQKYESPVLRRNISILIGELDTGGEIAKVLDSIIVNLRKSRMIKNEMAANTLMFTIFIGAIVLVISPLLFALAFNLLNILVGVTSVLGAATQSTEFMSFGDVDIDPENFKLFSVLALGIIALFASMIISIIQKGDIKGGIRYLPFFIATSTILYYFFLAIFSNFFTLTL